jgi:hypothetical protein
VNTSSYHSAFTYLANGPEESSNGNGNVFKNFKKKRKREKGELEVEGGDSLLPVKLLRLQVQWFRLCAWGRNCETRGDAARAHGM